VATTGEIVAPDGTTISGEEFLATLDEMFAKEYTWKIRPVLNFENFPTDLQGFQSYLDGQATPLHMDALIAFGDQTIPIQDDGILDGMNRIRSEIETNRIAMENSIRMVNDNLGNRISALGNDISSLRLTLNTGELVGGILRDIDRGLYEAGLHESMTGVPQG
jgi:hypothetical protein